MAALSRIPFNIFYTNGFIEYLSQEANKITFGMHQIYAYITYM